MEDLIESQQEKTHHDWQQSVIEASYYIEHLTDRGELVCDPFCGAATAAVAAKRLGREFWTCEIDQAAYAVAAQRIEAT